ncbi:phytoene/squalene synthase family protein [Parasphingorhabdus pacifica]
MTDHELDRAGIRHPDLRLAYRRCKQLNAAHGRTYFLATRMLSPALRPAVHALYGFARQVDDIVDGHHPNTARRDQLDGWERALLDGIAVGHSDEPILAALLDTAARHHIDPRLFTEFLTAMRMDLTVTDYATRDELERYMYGSAAVIGLQMLPVLGSVVDEATAAPSAAALGRAFQLTNFLRDVAEDMFRGRVYLPADELAAFGVDRARLQWCVHAGRPDQRVRRALADQVARTQAVYRSAEPGIRMLSPAARPCVSTAFVLYREILDRVVEADYDVFGRRLAVSTTRRLAVAAPTWSAATAGRLRAGLVNGLAGRRPVPTQTGRS